MNERSVNVDCLGVWMLSCLSCVYVVRPGCGDGGVIHVCGGGGALAVI